MQNLPFLRVGSGTTLGVRDSDGGALGVGTGWAASPDSMGVPGRLEEGWFSKDTEFCLFIELGAFTLETAGEMETKLITTHLLVNLCTFTHTSTLCAVNNVHVYKYTRTFSNETSHSKDPPPPK